MTTYLRPTLVFLAGMTLITGVLYPAAVTGVAGLLFPHQAQGSLWPTGGKVRGSVLIGQAFASPRYFWGRPSATAPAYNAAASSGSNLGPQNPALADAVKARVETLRAADPGNEALVPVDLVTASGSGLDPHLSVAGVRYQMSRVARARALDPALVEALVQRHVESRSFGVLGEPRVNVLHLNLALDSVSTGEGT